MEFVIKVLRNVVGVFLGLMVGGYLNMAIIENGHLLVPNPEGFDNSTMERLAETIHLLEPKHFMVVFLAHALGTLLGAIIASAIAAVRKTIVAMLIGAAFLVGGIMMVKAIPAPMWFNVMDLALAYIPMALIGGFIGQKIYSK